MSSIGIGILKSVIENDLPFSDILEAGIDVSFLEGAEIDAFEFVKNFKFNHSQYPNIATVEAEVPSVIFKHLPNEPVNYWAEELKTRKKFWILSRINNHLTEFLKKNKVNDAVVSVRKANEELLHINQEFAVEDLAKIQEDVLDRHDIVQRTAGISGIPYGFPILDTLTHGQQGGDFNVIIGQTGSGKSYFCIACAKAAYESGKKVLFISPEMPSQQIARRLLAMQLGISDKEIRKGQLSSFLVKKARKMIHEPITIEGETQDNWFKILPSGLYSDVHNVVAIAAEYKPDLLIVDGFYLLKNSATRSSQGWREDESVIFVLKNFSIHANIPILASTQYNRTSPGKLEGARGSQSVEQVASNFYSIEFETPADREAQMPVQSRILKVKKSRDGDSAVLKYEFDFKRTKITEDSQISGEQNESEDVYEDDEYMEDV